MEILDFCFFSIILIFVLPNIDRAISRCVLEYFRTFQICWIVILRSLVIMINQYIDFLHYLVKRLTKYPTIIWANLAIFTCLFFVNEIIKTIFRGDHDTYFRNYSKVLNECSIS